MGGLHRRRRLLPRHLHARLELRAGHAAPVPRARAHAARDRVRRRRRPTPATRCSAPPLPIRAPQHEFQAAADGQLGGIMKVYREWRISGDTGWLRALWPHVTQEPRLLHRTWDPRGKGVLEEPHHNTYDIEFWGPTACAPASTSARWQAAVRDGRGAGRGRDALSRAARHGHARARPGPVQRRVLLPEGRVGRPARRQSDRAEEHRRRRTRRRRSRSEAGRAEVPVRQRLLVGRRPRLVDGGGCGVGAGADRAKVESHLLAVHRHNLRARPGDARQPPAADLRVPARTAGC